GFHHRGVPHLQLGGKGFQHVVNPTAEQRRFHRAVPGFRALLRPLPQRLVRSPQFAFLDDLAVGGLDAVADAFLVNVESDIVFDVHWVLLIEVSEPVRKDRSRHYTLQGNPTAAPYLYIQTDSQFPANRAGMCAVEVAVRRPATPSSPQTRHSSGSSGGREWR